MGNTKSKKRLERIIPGKTHPKKAILVGLNYTGTKYALRGCINDAKRMRQSLIKLFGHTDVTIYTDQQLKKVTIIDLLTKLVGSGSHNLYFQYSGHGTQTPDYNGDESDGLDEALFSVNNRLVTDDQINAIIKSVKEGVQLVLVIDACHSGTITDLPYKLINDRAVRVGSNKIDGDIICISGCRDNQVSMDINSGLTSYGAMSNALQKVLQKTKGNICWKQLINLMQVELKNDGMAQIPELTVSRPELIYSLVSF